MDGDILSQFISLIRQWIGVAIYVLNGQGELITSADQIRRMENSTTNANRAIELWTKRGKRCTCFDCSGLVVWALMFLGLITADMKADGIYDKCPKIEKSKLSLGDFAFRINSDGNAHHIGIITRFDGYVPWVTEARGRDDGVVELPIDFEPGYWERYGENIFLEEVLEMMACKFGDKNSVAVNELQKKLVKAYGQMAGDDGAVYGPGQETFYYGTATKNGVLKLLKEYGLPGDGKNFDAIGSAALTFKLAGIKPTTGSGITQEQYDAAKKTIAGLTEQLEKAKDDYLDASQQLKTLAANERIKASILANH